MSGSLEDLRRLLALADAGLMYGRDVFDKERYQEMKSILTKMIGEYTSLDDGKIKCVLDKEEGYPTPKVDVRAFIEDNDGKILLVQDIKSREWSLPGGYADIGYSAAENVIKEVFEETGYHVAVDKLAGIFDTDKRKDIPQLFQYYKLFFNCTVLDGTFMSNNETAACDFFDIKNLPKLSEKRTTYEQLCTLKNRKDMYLE
ncbi:NUDIX hydrolase [Vagococcus vulneris]|uniref:DNA mismatch repair protein MutT n=1 Tax=Vagococcus vulneris TaxID=1977869 RepID=A0A430A0W5_9ENTE|nr:NUDIX hydrolase [Vagococcus vulneris]RSU00038.1 DNA mismatch repair protein MutT [Vagococcus vulneris]